MSEKPVGGRRFARMRTKLWQGWSDRRTQPEALRLMTWPCETLAYLPQLPTWGKGQMRGGNGEKKQQQQQISRKDCFVREVNDFVHPLYCKQ